MIKCPANYFGRGENYNLPDDPSIIQEIQVLWSEWEREHPGDPTGDKALAEWKAKNPDKPAISRDKIPRALEEDEEEIFDNSECVNLRLQVPIETCRLFKNYAKLKRIRPRELLILWVAKYAKL